MSHNDQNQPQGVAYYESKETYPVTPPAIITHEGYSDQNVPPSGETKFKGSGFWRGCCAGLCCYWCLDICF
ncbi:Cysteine-rich transmembrane CYSTM domain [Sesbania bispinosa]|nr:Cysteine-rich transmembrane CYSTM domain [Sesbania bispinosa]